MTPTTSTPPLTLADIARQRLEMRRAAKAQVVAQSAYYSGHYA